jgi:transcriptional regulator with XRE-family HTH domain
VADTRPPLPPPPTPQASLRRLLRLWLGEFSDVRGFLRGTQLDAAGIRPNHFEGVLSGNLTLPSPVVSHLAALVPPRISDRRALFQVAQLSSQSGEAALAFTDDQATTLLTATVDQLLKPRAPHLSRMGFTLADFIAEEVRSSAMQDPATMSITARQNAVLDRIDLTRSQLLGRAVLTPDEQRHTLDVLDQFFALRTEQKRRLRLLTKKPAVDAVIGGSFEAFPQLPFALAYLTRTLRVDLPRQPEKYWTKDAGPLVQRTIAALEASSALPERSITRMQAALPDLLAFADLAADPSAPLRRLVGDRSPARFLEDSRLAGFVDTAEFTDAINGELPLSRALTHSLLFLVPDWREWLMTNTLLSPDSGTTCDFATEDGNRRFLHSLVHDPPAVLPRSLGSSMMLLARVDAGMTTSQFAERIKVNPRWVRRFETTGPRERESRNGIDVHDKMPARSLLRMLEHFNPAEVDLETLARELHVVRRKSAMETGSILDDAIGDQTDARFLQRVGLSGHVDVLHLQLARAGYLPISRELGQYLAFFLSPNSRWLHLISEERGLGDLELGLLRPAEAPMLFSRLAGESDLDLKAGALHTALRMTRLRSKLTNDEFGAALGVDGNTVKTYTNAQRVPSGEFLERLSKTFDISPFNLSHLLAMRQVLRNPKELEVVPPESEVVESNAAAERSLREHRDSLVLELVSDRTITRAIRESGLESLVNPVDFVALRTSHRALSPALRDCLAFSMRDFELWMKASRTGFRSPLDLRHARGKGEFARRVARDTYLFFPRPPLATVLRLARSRAGVDRAHFAAHLGVTAADYTKFERGRAVISREALMAVQTHYDTSPFSAEQLLDLRHLAENEVRFGYAGTGAVLRQAMGDDELSTFLRRTGLVDLVDPERMAAALHGDGAFAPDLGTALTYFVHDAHAWTNLTRQRSDGLPSCDFRDPDGFARHTSYLIADHRQAAGRPLLSTALFLARQESGMSADDFAKELNTATGIILDYEQGFLVPTAEMVRKVAKQFGTRSIDPDGFAALHDKAVARLPKVSSKIAAPAVRRSRDRRKTPVPRLVDLVRRLTDGAPSGEFLNVAKLADHVDVESFDLVRSDKAAPTVALGNCFGRLGVMAEIGRIDQWRCAADISRRRQRHQRGFRTPEEFDVYRGLEISRTAATRQGNLSEVSTLLRHLAGKSRIEFAEALGLPLSVVAGIEREQGSGPTRDFVDRLSRLVELPARDDALVRHLAVDSYIRSGKVEQNITAVLGLLGHNPRAHGVEDICGDIPPGDFSSAQQDNARVMDLIEAGFLPGYVILGKPSPWPEVLRQVRREYDLSAGEAVAKVDRHGLHEGVWDDLERGHRRPTHAEQQALFQTFDITWEPGMSPGLLDDIRPEGATVDL